MKTLKDLFLDELADLYDAEKRIVRALPKMAKAATCEDLEAALLAHLKESEGHVTKLEQVFRAFDEKVRSTTCEATVGLLKEGDAIMADYKGSSAINAALVSAAQKVEHHEIAAYGCLHEWAELLDNEDAASLLHEILEEERSANDSFTVVARATCNEQAMDESEDIESDDDGEKPVKKQMGARPTGTKRKPAEVLVK